MKLLKYLTLILFTGTLAISLNSCKRDKEDCFDPTNPQCKNYDPCYGKKPVMADIEISQRVKNFGSDSLSKAYFNETEIFPYSQIRFHCPLEGAKYTWTLGAETITSQTFERIFEGFQVPYGEYTVKLTVEKEPNKNCFPADDGIDTYTKKFKIVPTCSLAILGLFKGKWDNLPQKDSGLISMRVFTSMNYLDSCGTSLFRFTNLTSNQDTLLGDNIYVSNTEIINDRVESTGLANGRFKINLQDSTVLMTYTVNGVPFTFRGRRLSK